jgi:electron-transferring-flavoprotein dehydrogenase
VPAGRVKPGKIVHSFGWPADSKPTAAASSTTWMGSHRAGLRLGPRLPGSELPALRSLPAMEEPSQREIRCSTAAAILSAGARAIVTGGWQSLPKVEMPGALLIGDTAGLLNVPKIKGTHQAIRSGMLAAEHLATSGKRRRLRRQAARLARDGRAEESAQRQARLQARLVVRHGERGLGNRGGRRSPWTLKNKPDWSSLHKLRRVTSRPDATTRIAPCRRATASPASTSPPPNTMKTSRCISRWPTPTSASRPAPPSTATPAPASARPASTRSSSMRRSAGKRLQINAANCVHCKTCDIKDPYQIINWVTPEGGAGPNYQNL